MEYTAAKSKFTFEFKPGDCFKRFFKEAKFPATETGQNVFQPRKGFSENPKANGFLSGFALSGDVIGCQVVKFSDHNNKFVYKSETALKSEKKGGILSAGGSNLKFARGFINTEFWLLRLEKEEDKWVTKSGSYWVYTAKLRSTKPGQRVSAIRLEISTLPNGRKGMIVADRCSHNEYCALDDHIAEKSVTQVKEESGRRLFYSGIWNHNRSSKAEFLHPNAFERRMGFDTYTAIAKDPKTKDTTNSNIYDVLISRKSRLGTWNNADTYCEGLRKTYRRYYEVPKLSRELCYAY